MKFDVDEAWTLLPGQRGTMLVNVATHEFGHLMGLSHSRLQTALMAPYYNAAIAVPQSQDDITRFQARYGVRQGPVTPPVPVPVPAPGVARVEITGAVTVLVNGRQIA